MVQVIQPYNRMAHLGSLFGQGLGQGASKQADIAIQRGMTKDALKQLKPGSTGYETITNLLSSTAGLPDQGRIVQALAPHLMQLMQGETASSPKTTSTLEDIEKTMGDFEPGETQKTFNLPKFQVSTGGGLNKGTLNQKTSDYEVAETFENVLPLINRSLPESYHPNIDKSEEKTPGESFKPQQRPIKPIPLTPSDKSKIRSKLAKDANIKDLSIQDKYISDYEKLRDDTYQAQLSGYESVKDYQKAQQDEDKRFFDEVGTPILQKLDQPLQNIWKGIARLSQNSGPDEARLRNTQQMFDKMILNPLSSFDQLGPELPNVSVLTPDKVKSNLEDARSNIQEHLVSFDNRDDIPKDLRSEIKNTLRDKYSTSLAGKDWGTAQQAYATSNLNDKISRSIPQAPVRRRYSLTRGMHDVENEFFNNNPQTRKKYVDRLSDVLSNLNEEDSLLLAREKALQNHYDDASFNEALNQAVNSGRLVLSTFQRNERQKLGVPQRLDLDSVMRGKRSIFDLFKAKK